MRVKDSLCLKGVFLITILSSEFSEPGSPSPLFSAASSLLAEAAILYSVNRRSLQDTAVFHSKCRTLLSDMESELQICDVFDQLFDVKDFADL